MKHRELIPALIVENIDNSDNHSEAEVESDDGPKIISQDINFTQPRSSTNFTYDS
jgi:hypothetical protein